MSNDNIFYVYTYTDPRNDEIIYVGKGKGNRYLDRWKERNYQVNKYSPLTGRLNKIAMEGFEPIIKIVLSDISEQEAFEYEIFLIGEYGRRDTGMGTLWNLTDGGEGGSGYIYSDARKDQIKAVWADSAPILCYNCGKECKTLDGHVPIRFKEKHFENCRATLTTLEQRRTPLTRAAIKTDISFLMDQCETLQEFEARRFFYGFLANPEKNNDTPSAYVVNCTEDTKFVTGKGSYKTDYFRKEIDKELMDYSLKGLESFDIY